jgi:hypothetical protein
MSVWVGKLGVVWIFVDILTFGVHRLLGMYHCFGLLGLVYEMEAWAELKWGLEPTG